MAETVLANGSVVPAAVAARAARSEQLVADQAAKRAAQSPTPPVAPPPVPDQQEFVAEAPVTDGSNDPDNRYNSMKGRYEKERSEKERLLQQLSEQQRLLAALQAAPAPQTTSPQTATRLITPKEEQEYGEEMIDLVGRRAREVVSPEIEALKNTIAQLERRIGGVASSVRLTAQEAMFEDLTAQLPNWKQINVNPDFHAWLGLPDHYSGVIRQQLLEQAFAGNQTARVLAFFKGFIADEAASRPAGMQETQQVGTRVPTVSLESLAAPGRAKQSGGTVPPAEKQTYTRAQIAAFYRAVNAGYYAGRDADRVALEKDIFAATSEGRIRN